MSAPEMGKERDGLGEGRIRANVLVNRKFFMFQLGRRRRR